MYKIRHVEGEEYHEELLEMQTICLPWCDKPLSVEDGGEWWIVFFEDVPVGFGAIKTSVRWRYTGHLSRAGILPGHRGQGLQRRLIRVRERWAKQQGWEWLITDTNGTPSSANNLAKCGFLMYDPKIQWGLAGAIYWRKYIGGKVKSVIPH